MLFGRWRRCVNRRRLRLRCSFRRKPAMTLPDRLPLPVLFILVCLALLGLLSACAPASQPTEQPAGEPAEEIISKEVEVTVEVEKIVSEPTKSAEPQPLATQPPPAPTSTVVLEARLVEMEWPAEMRLGESDIVRLALIASENGYTVEAVYPEHRTDVQPVQVARLEGFDLFAVARLDGVGFEIAPAGEQPQHLPPGEKIEWQWSLRPLAVGQQRVSLVLLLRWAPISGANGGVRERAVFSRSLDIRIRSFFGLTQSQAMAGGAVGLVLGFGLCLFGLILPAPVTSRAETAAAPNQRLVIEVHPGLKLSPDEEGLLRVLFRRYARLALAREFLSGYSGARALLARPIHADGRADADTIVKIGLAGDVQREFASYERFVKDTLPPITARIQHPPVLARGGALGALRYTFIGAPGHTPVSLRQALLDHPDSSYLSRLFETFGPNWWMQRKPYTFRLAVEYDRVLPVHLVLEPCAGRGLPIDGSTAPESLDLRLGDLVTLRDFPSIEPRPDRRSLSLHGRAQPGQPELRVRWLSLANPNGATGRIVATRASQLREFSIDLERFGLPDPIPRLPDLLAETVRGSQSTIHGDLNLENILVGPGGFIWLIDFAQTRDGHTLFDFAHLGAELIAHVIAPQVESPLEYFELLLENPFNPSAQPQHPLAKLLTTLSAISAKCLFNPAQPMEFQMALCLACLGALKYQNLDFQQKHLLFLTAAYQCAAGAQ
jgi:hypothetical protein